MIDLAFFELLANYGLPTLFALLFYFDFRKILLTHTDAIEVLTRYIIQTHPHDTR